MLVFVRGVNSDNYNLSSAATLKVLKGLHRLFYCYSALFENWVRWKLKIFFTIFFANLIYMLILSNTVDQEDKICVLFSLQNNYNRCNFIANMLVWTLGENNSGNRLCRLKRLKPYGLNSHAAYSLFIAVSRELKLSQALSCVIYCNVILGVIRQNIHTSGSDRPMSFGFLSLVLIHKR